MSKRTRILIEDTDPIEFTEEQEAEIARQMALAEQEEDVRINFRWRKGALDTVKQAAEQMGMGYQAYLKQAAYRQAIQDLQAGAQVRELAKAEDVSTK